jgi:HAD superfamily hydrolase (TIGR01509 family)
MRALIFDFDGVIADSEMLANTVLAEWVSCHGLPTTVEQAMQRYLGKRWPEVIAAVEAQSGRALPADFPQALKMATLERFRAELQEVPGAAAFVRRHAHWRRGIASSSAADRLGVCLERLGLAEDFGEHVYSAELVERGKPAPDIFLLAASRLGVAPADCIVIEDSAGGVRAGLAAGMTVIGLCAASHVSVGHAEVLRAAGAHHVAADWEEVGAFVSATS